MKVLEKFSASRRSRVEVKSTPSMSFRICVALIWATGFSATGFLATGCTPNQMKSIVNSVKSGPAAETEEEAEPAPAAAVVKSRPKAKPATPGSAVDVDPGSGRYVTLLEGFRMIPPETFNVISEEEGSDFRSNYRHYRWERLSGGAWMIVTFLSGMDYEGERAQDIQDPRVVKKRIREAFKRIDPRHQLQSNGSQGEKLAGIDTVRSNVLGKIEGEDAIGHLYLLQDGKHLIEIVAVATEPNRDALKACRQAANSLTR